MDTMNIDNSSGLGNSKRTENMVKEESGSRKRIESSKNETCLAAGEKEQQWKSRSAVMRKRMLKG